MLVLPPTNHLKKGALESSRTFDHGSYQSSSLASDSQKATGWAAALSRIAS
jgi:hypothetical protein